MTSPTLSPDGPVRRCFVLEDRRKHVVQPRRGANHTGIADTSERWFCTDAGLHKRILPRVTRCIPRRSRYIVKKSKPSRTHATLTPTTSMLSRPTRRDGEGERGQHKAMFLAARVPTRTRALPPPTPYTHTIIITHGEREAKMTKTTTRLNRRYLAKQPA